MSHLDQEILELINKFRAENGLPSFKDHRDLSGIAKKHAAAVAEGRAPFDHTGAQQRFEACRTRWVNAAENLAKIFGEKSRESLPEAIVSFWCEDEVHRRNLLGPFDVCGTGWAASDSGDVFVTQLLAKLDERSNYRVEMTETAKNAALSTPALSSVVGLAVAGSAGAVWCALGGAALEYKFGLKVSSLPLLVKDRIQAMCTRRACCQCGASDFVAAIEDATQEASERVQLSVSSSDGRLLCQKCADNVEEDWCFVD